MLQRIQTIFLFMAMLAGLSLLIDPMTLASVEGDVDVLKSQPQSMLEDGIFHVTDHLILLLLVGLTSFLALVDIFQFRNRQRQVALARGVLIGFILILLLAAVFFYQDYSQLNQGPYLFEIGFGGLAPLAGIISTTLAIRAINKDDKLIRSMDRLR
ncbi:MAG: DUF4293 domain-containing protein [Lewinellaceae bacterium]|nr:DUF4293 domain-containing protein [Saprospiraceae bacterium]MCB9314288.1 DUF4293 domain-containing protein [Lewinellaceae bacterium]HRW74511.1 DUF4293 domain-containing protein [Saprospiraceae bacterium]